MAYLLPPTCLPLTPGNTVLRGVPKSMADRINEVLLEITPDYRIARIQFQEADESVTEYRFSEQRRMSKSPTSAFALPLPRELRSWTASFGSRVTIRLI